MSNLFAIIFALAFVFHALTVKYIFQLVREVNERTTGQRVSIWRWNRGWGTHRQFYATSPVRHRIVTSIALTVVFGLKSNRPIMAARYCFGLLTTADAST